jgi:hypothetical protein
VATTTLLKLVLSPLLILVATLCGRRWGGAVGGWVAGLPLTSAPVSFILALEQGPQFAARAALGTLFGLISLAGFCVAYRLVAWRGGWIGGLAAALIGFAGCTLLFRDVTLSLWFSFALVCAVLAAVAAAMTSRDAPRAQPPLLPGDLALRMGLAGLIVVLLTSTAELLGPELAGSLTPLPVFGGLLAVFAHREQGPAAAVRLLQGMVMGSFGFAAFFLIVGALLGGRGILATYLTASVAALGIHGLTLACVRRLG